MWWYHGNCSQSTQASHTHCRNPASLTQQKQLATKKKLEKRETNEKNLSDSCVKVEEGREERKVRMVVILC